MCGFRCLPPNHARFPALKIINTASFWQTARISHESLALHKFIKPNARLTWGRGCSGFRSKFGRIAYDDHDHLLTPRHDAAAPISAAAAGALPMSLLANQHPEPTEEEDISRAGVYHDEPAPSGSSGAKGKQRAENPFDDDDENASEDEYDSGEKGYPPTNDEEAESRRIEEVRSRHLKAITGPLTLCCRTYDAGRQRRDSAEKRRGSRHRRLPRRRSSATSPAKLACFGLDDGGPASRHRRKGRGSTTAYGPPKTASRSTTSTPDSPRRRLRSPTTHS